jgi:RNA-directed DNA polymerase
MAKKLVLDGGKAAKIKRVWIPKANGTLRPLGIPTLEDRAKQCLVKLALEPEWEARFETKIRMAFDQAIVPRTLNG